MVEKRYKVYSGRKNYILVQWFDTAILVDTKNLNTDYLYISKSMQ